MPAQYFQKELLPTWPVIRSHSYTHGELFMIDLATEETVYQRPDIYVCRPIGRFALHVRVDDDFLNQE